MRHAASAFRVSGVCLVLLVILLCGILVAVAASVYSIRLRRKRAHVRQVSRYFSIDLAGPAAPPPSEDTHS